MPLRTTGDCGGIATTTSDGSGANAMSLRDFAEQKLRERIEKGDLEAIKVALSLQQYPIPTW